MGQPCAHGDAPSLPEAYTKAIDRPLIRTKQVMWYSPCRQRTGFVTDIILQDHTMGTVYRTVVEGPMRLRGLIGTTPITGASGKVLGSLRLWFC